RSAFPNRVWERECTPAEQRSFAGFLAALALAAVVGLALGCTSARADDRELTVPTGGLKIDGVVRRNNPQGAPLPANVYLVKLSAKKKYRIEMTAQNQQQLDAFLVVQDLQGKVLATDDNSGGGRNARLFFSPPQDGTYKVFAAALKGLGKFTLRLTE